MQEEIIASPRREELVTMQGLRAELEHFADELKREIVSKNNSLMEDIRSSISLSQSMRSSQYLSHFADGLDKGGLRQSSVLTNQSRRSSLENALKTGNLDPLPEYQSHDEFGVGGRPVTVHRLSFQENVSSGQQQAPADATRTGDEIPQEESPFVPQVKETSQLLIPRAQARELTDRSDGSAREVMLKQGGETLQEPESDSSEEMMARHSSLLQSFSRGRRHKTRRQFTQEFTDFTVLEDRPSALQERIHELYVAVNSPFFAKVACIIAVLNAMLVGVETHFMATYWTETTPLVFHIIDGCFCVFFVVEIVLRLSSVGCSAFFCSDLGDGWLWNLFDLCSTVMQVASLALPSQLGHFLKWFRVIRTIRMVRVLRLLRSVGELRMLTVSIQHSLKSLGWVLLLLFMMIYIMAVFLTQEVTTLKVQQARFFEGQGSEQLPEVHRRQLEMLLEYFGSTDRSIVSLYAMVADGIEWESLMKPLANAISPWMRLLFLAFSAFAFFAVMNAVTGVFVESAIYSASEDKKSQIAKEMRKLVKGRGDAEDGEDEISWEEFENQLQGPEIKAALNAVDLDAEDARDLFRLLDMDGSGTVDTSELVDGTYRLMGQAKALDLATLMHEFKRISSKQISHMTWVENTLVDLKEQMNTQTPRSNATSSPRFQATTPRGLTRGPTVAHLKRQQSCLAQSGGRKSMVGGLPEHISEKPLGSM